MAKQRAIVHCMHETDVSEAENILPDVEASTESYVVASVDEFEEKILRDRNLFVEYIDEPEEYDIQPEIKKNRIKLKSLQPVLRAGEDEASTYIVQLNGPILNKQQLALRNLDVVLREALGRNLYIARLSLKQFHSLQMIPFVVRVVPYYAETNLRPTLRSGTGTQKKLLTYDIRVNTDDGVAAAAVTGWLEQNNVHIAGRTKRKIRIYLPEESQTLDDLSLLDDILSIEEYVKPKIRNDRARVILGLDSATAAGSTHLSQTGKGQIVGVADTGIDDQHPDLQHLKNAVGLGRIGKHDDPDGHGTHVCGSIAGDGTSSGGKIKGLAPECELFVQSLLDPSGGLDGLPLDLNDLFQEAYNEGVRIHNNSWGAETRSKYVGTSMEVDEFVWKNPDFFILFAIGNEGQAALRLNSKKGYVDWLSANSPASAKNSLSVGASRSDRTSGGYSQMTWSSAWPRQFPDAPIGIETVSGDPECLAGFSSRGPSDDRRILPHVVAPGTDILSTKSSTAPVKNFWGPYPGNNQYAYNGGTSMACPIVAGCAALVRQYYVENRQHTPSAALLKATLVNSTVTLTGADALADHGFIPNYHQGFGRVNMSVAIPEDDKMLCYIDTLTHAADLLDLSGRKRRYRFNIKHGATNPLRICLSWTDPPGRAIQNQLNLFLQQPNGRKYTGNERLPGSLGIPDPDNNTQIIRIDNPDPGTYLVQVTATNLLKPPQHFALVIYGDLDDNGVSPG